MREVWLPVALEHQSLHSGAGLSGTADIAAILVNWNTRDLLRACLHSLTNEDHRRLRRVIVVDNASTDGSAEMVCSEFPSVELLTPGKNTGYAAGNNLCLAQVTEPYALLLNPDTVIEEGAVDTLAAFMDSHPTCAAVAPQLLSPDGSVQASCRGFPTPLALLAEFTGLSRAARLFPTMGTYRIAGWNHDTEREVDQPMGSALLVRMAAVDQVGRMDEQFPLYFNEVDWLYRMKQAGWKIWFTPAAQVLHHHGASTRQIWVRAAWLSHRGLHAFYQKHFRGSIHPILYVLLVGLIYIRALVVMSSRILKGLTATIRRGTP
ncbi:MAG: glycosyltransferase family 2 protein [Armatimonadota bacterium]|nr:glycosyltransferase family 2 protein [Armatimonadota bacterium]